MSRPIYTTEQYNSTKVQIDELANFLQEILASSGEHYAKRRASLTLEEENKDREMTDSLGKGRKTQSLISPGEKDIAIYQEISKGEHDNEARYQIAVYNRNRAHCNHCGRNLLNLEKEAKRNQHRNNCAKRYLNDPLWIVAPDEFELPVK